MDRQERNARAAQEVTAYRERVARGIAEPREHFLTQHEDLRDLMEPLLAESQAVTASVPPVGEPPLPDALRREILALHSVPTELRERKLDELCEEHSRHADHIRGFIQSLERAEDRVIAAVHETAPAPEQIGPYRILSVLGEGGMGTVYIAEQKKPVRRRVALKVIKLGMDSKQVLLRFESERQALAMMEHSNIAKVFEAGTTGRGQPFFAMEYVKGKPITQYCDHQKLSLEERLDLFQQVCFGVQHAHQKGVIHRDLKPSNVLVSDQDGKPTAKIIDFGVARATDHRLVEATIFTEQGVIVGTPEYMSPEQAGLDALDVDTRSDVYALGVLLFELLVGELPFSGAELRQGGLREMERKIREEDPPRPSTRLTGSGASTAVAQQRRTDVSSLSRRIKGDLDWIAMKALEKNRNRRYQTAIELAQDIERHLADEPVIARRPGVGYRASKFLRRNRVGVSAALLVAAGMVAALHGIVSGLAAEQLIHAQRPYVDAQRLRSLEQRAHEDLWPPHPDLILDLDMWRTDAEELAGTLANHRADLEEMDKRADVSQTAIARQATLRELVEGLEALVDDNTGLLGESPDAASPLHGWSVPRRRAFAKSLKEGFAPGGKYAKAWDDAREEEDLDLDTQMGLVPIGKDPHSGLWEFAHLMTGEPATRDGDQNLVLTETTGVVLVLIPSGEFSMGSQGEDPKGDNYVKGAGINTGPVRTVELSRMLLSKYEMTQGQWKTLTGDNPSRYGPHHREEWDLKWLLSGQEPSLLHPVEQVSWNDCELWLGRAGLSLPTEAQWEHGARGGTPNQMYWTGRNLSDLSEAANLSDDYARDNGGREHQPPPPHGSHGYLDDGSTMHAPVGSYLPNKFGLHDVHGNLFEWCLDGFHGDAYELDPEPDKDPVVRGEGDLPRVYRGGSYRTGPGVARSGARSYYPPSMRGHALGVRPAKVIEEN